MFTTVKTRFQRQAAPPLLARPRAHRAVRDKFILPSLASRLTLLAANASRRIRPLVGPRVERRIIAMVKVRKRRPLWFYFLLPLGVALLSILAVGLFALQRAKLVAPLADAVAGGDTQEAVTALRQLARMTAPPFDILVSAAAARDPQIAAAAKSSIDDILRTHQTRIQSARRLSAVADQLAVLARMLAEKQKLFPTEDQGWIGSTAHEVLRLANQIPNSTAPDVAATCDEILAGVAAATAAAPSPAARHRPAPFEPSLPARGINMLPQEGGDEAIAAMDADPFPPNERGVLPPSPPLGAGPLVSALPKMPDRPVRAPLPSTDDAPFRPGKPPTRDWRPQWGNSTPSAAASPQMKIVSVRPVESATAPFAPSPHTGPVPATADRSSLAEVPPKKLLEQWLAANKADAAAIEGELARRGFGRLSRRLVELFFSDNRADRLQLVDDLLTAPDIGARPWMLLLADDPSADVRLSAITIMATSNDRVLLDKAFQVAIRDSDPRIANMAARLNERRSAAGLR
jgi:hypothetical protein